MPTCKKQPNKDSMPIAGSPKFNALTLLEIEAIDFSNRGHSITAHGAFIDTKTGATYGSTTCTHWSKQTLDALEELRNHMEQDMANLVFEMEGTTASGGPLFDPEPGGIGEHAAEVDSV